MSFHVINSGAKNSLRDILHYSMPEIQQLTQIQFMYASCHSMIIQENYTFATSKYSDWLSLGIRTLVDSKRKAPASYLTSAM
jgi:hypothetical protein